MKRITKLLLLLISIYWQVNNLLYAQQEFTLYHMPTLSQSTYLNVANVPEHSVSLSLPIPSVYVGFNNSALSVKSFVDKDGTVDYTNFVNNLSEKRNYIGLGANVELFHLRLKAANNFYSIHSRLVNDFRFIYPRDFIGIAAEGLQNGYSLSGLGVHFSSYMEYGIGFTRSVPDSKWTYGGRLKLLKGIANIQTKSSELDLSVNQNDIYQYNLNANMEMNVGLGLDKNSVSSLNDAGDLDDNELRKARKLNNGFAIDGGVTLQFNEKLSFGLALNNLGFIKWNNYTENYKMNAQLAFEGATINNLDFSSNLDSTFNAQIDSVLQSYEETIDNGIDTTNNAYTTWLPANVFLSAHYQLTPRIKTSLSLYTEFFKGISVGVVAATNFSVTRRLDLTTSWWWFRKSAANLGLGVVYKPGPFQLYLVMDNILPASFVKISDPELEIDGLILPYQIKNFNLRLGMNLVFGRIKNEGRLPNQGLSKRKHGFRKFLYKPSLK